MVKPVVANNFAEHDPAICMVKEVFVVTGC